MHHHIRGHKLFIIEILWMLGIASVSFLVVSHLDILAASPPSHAAPFASSGDWSRFMYSDMHQGNNPNETILNTGNASSLTLKWHFKTPGSLIAEPIIVNGIIYQGSDDGNMYAIDATTHQQLWQTLLGRHSISTCPVSYGITGTAAVDNGMVFIGEGYTFYALNTSNGQIVWQTSLAINSNLADNVLWGAPAVANGKVYIGLASDCDKPLIQGILYALDENSGRIVASAKMVPDGFVGGGIWSAPTIDAATGTVIVSTGSVEKSPPFAGINASFASSAYVNGTLFIAGALTTINGTSYASSIGAFDALTGQLLWRFGLPGRIFASLTTANGLLFDGQGKTFEVRDQSNGNLLFSYTFPSNSIKGAITVLNGLVYVPSVDDKLYVFGL